MFCAIIHVVHALLLFIMLFIPCIVYDLHSSLLSFSECVILMLLNDYFAHKTIKLIRKITFLVEWPSN